MVILKKIVFCGLVLGMFWACLGRVWGVFFVDDQLKNTVQFHGIKTDSEPGIKQNKKGKISAVPLYPITADLVIMESQ